MFRIKNTILLLGLIPMCPVAAPLQCVPTEHNVHVVATLQMTELSHDTPVLETPPLMVLPQSITTFPSLYPHRERISSGRFFFDTPHVLVAQGDLVASDNTLANRFRIPMILLPQMSGHTTKASQELNGHRVDVQALYCAAKPPHSS